PWLPSMTRAGPAAGAEVGLPGGHPAGPPVVPVEVDQRQVEPAGDLAGERLLPAPALPTIRMRRTGGTVAPTG
ncbi:hypothetical protein, partial [Micromonospora sp. I033]